MIIPMMHTRQDDSIIFHGAKSSRLMRYLGGGGPICLSVAIVDGLVLAKSLFHHSMNYRSVVAFGKGKEIESDSKKLEALKAISDKVMPGRWNDARLPNEQELKATAVVSVCIDSASAKIREGGPVDDPEDLELPHWAGVVPLSLRAQPAIEAEAMGDKDDSTPSGVERPVYLKQFVEGYRQ